VPNAKSNFKAAVKRAKALYKTGRYNKFSDAVAAAYKKGPAKKSAKKKRKVGAYKVVEKGEKRSTPARKVIRVTRSKKGTFKGSTVAGAKAAIEQKLGRAMVEHYKTQSIKRTRVLGKTIAGYKKQLKAFN